MPKESAMQTKNRTGVNPASPTYKGGQRAFGKPSGLKSQAESAGVAWALNQPVAGTSAYEQALAEGRSMLSTPYTTASPPKNASRAEYDLAVEDSAGNYRKESRPLVSKPRPEGKFGA